MPNRDARPPRARRRRSCVTAALVLTVLAGFHRVAIAAEPQGAQPTLQGERPVQVTIYPILVQAPIFGATVNFPDLPNFPGSGGSGSTDVSLNAAYFVGGLVESRLWFADVNGVWAAVDASHSAPRVSVNSDSKVFNAIGGVRVFHNFFATGGVRRVTSDLDATLQLPSLGTTLSGSTSVGLWDPMIGAQYRGHLTRRTKIYLDFRGGGFGVGTDVDISGEASADWQFIRHVVLRLGYTALYYKLTVADVNVGSIQRTLKSSQTLHGPEVGIGVTF